MKKCIYEVFAVFLLEMAFTGCAVSENRIGADNTERAGDSGMDYSKKG